MHFQITHKQDRARVGIITTPHGEIKTPAFLPVATRAAIKALSINQVKELDTQILMCNTYHLMLKPGNETVKQLGGLHRFMNWPKPLMTDSGGFQAMSLGSEVTKKIGWFPEEKTEAAPRHERFSKITEDGVEFRSVYDHSTHFLTPERSMQIQHDLGADMIMAFDECTNPLESYEYTKASMERTHRWAERSLAEHTKLNEAQQNKQALFGIIQGGEFEDLRLESSKFITSLPFDGFAIGGWLGRTKEEMHTILEWIIPYLDDKPVHMLGIGTVEDLFECIERGMDTFDCVGPTRIARTGYAYILPQSGGTQQNKYRAKINTTKYTNSTEPLDPNCDCNICKNHTKGYINHLFKAKEYSALAMLSYHNIHFMQKLIADIRQSIIDNKFYELKKEWLQ